MIWDRYCTKYTLKHLIPLNRWSYAVDIISQRKRNTWIIGMISRESNSQGLTWSSLMRCRCSLIFILKIVIEVGLLVCPISVLEMSFLDPIRLQSWPQCASKTQFNTGKDAPLALHSGKLERSISAFWIRQQRHIPTSWDFQKSKAEYATIFWCLFYQLGLTMMRLLVNNLQD